MWPHIWIRRGQRANVDGQRALTDGDLLEAERAFNAALRHVERKNVKNQSVAEIAAEANLGMGRVCLAHYDFDEAEARFDQVRRLRPTLPEGFYWSGCAAAHCANFQRAEWFFGAALARDARLGKAYVQRAYVRLRRDQEDLALDDLMAAAHCQALDGKARLLTSALLLRRGDWTHAESMARDAAAEEPEAVAMLAIAQYRQGKVEAAFDTCGRAIVGDDPDDTALVRYGMIAYQLGRFTASIDAWTTLCARHPQHEEFRTLVAAAHHARAGQRVAGADYSGAIDDLNAANLARDEREPDAIVAELHLYAAAQAIKSADREKAREHLTASADSRAPHYLALIDFLDGALASAEMHWKRVLEITPAEPKARFGVALCAVHQRRPADDELRNLNGNDTPAPIRHLAGRALAACFIRDGNWSAAVPALVLDGDPRWARLFAECLYRSGRDAELLGLPENPWQDLARLRSGHFPERGDLAANGDGQRDDRAHRELILMLRDGAFAAAAQEDWARAAALFDQSGGNNHADRYSGIVEAVVRGLGGHRTDALRWLRDAARRNPTDHRIGHVLALMLLHSLGATRPGQAESSSWRECIGVWMSLLHSETFWAGWLRAVRHRYGCPIPAKDEESLRASLRELIERRLPTNGTDRMPLLLRRENEGARLLSELGGLPLPGRDDEYLVCGPLRISQLGLERELSRFFLSLPNSTRKLDDIIRQFSLLGLADSCLALGRAAEAVELALDLRCPACREDTRDIRPSAASGPLLCATDCPGFDEHDPAFAAFGEKHYELSRFAATFAANASLEIARSEITKADINLAKAGKRWRDAIDFTQRFDDQHKILELMTDTALGRARSLSQRKDLTNAIAVLDAVLPVVGSRDTTQQGKVAGQLAMLLNARAVRTLEEDHSQVRSAQADLERAVKLSPTLLIRTNLGVLLRDMAHKRLEARDITETVRLLNDATEQFNRALADRPGDPELLELLRETQSAVAILLGVLSGHPRRDRRR